METRLPRKCLTPQAITDYDLREWQRSSPGGEAGRDRTDTETGHDQRQDGRSKSFLNGHDRTRVIQAMPDAPPPAIWRARRANGWTRRTTPASPGGGADRNPRNPALVEILIETGLRVAELVALRWHLDVKLGERKGSVTSKGKGCKPRGPLPLITRSRRAFQKLRDLGPGRRREPQSSRASARTPLRGRNKPLTVRGVQELLMPLCRQAGLGAATSTPASPHARGELSES